MPVLSERYRWTLLEAARRFGRDDGSALAGHLAFTALLSIFPFLIFATALAGLLIGEGNNDRAVTALFNMTPEHVAQTLAPVLKQVLSANNGRVLTISALASIYAASNGFEALRVSFNRAYDVKTRTPFWRRRLQSVAMVAVSALVFLMLTLLIILAPVIETMTAQYVEIPPRAAIVFTLLRYAVGLLMFSGFLYMLHRTLPSQSMKSVLLWPGVAISVGLWTAGASAFSNYLRYAPSYTITYGGLSGVVVTLLFFYLTGASIIFGAEWNAARAADLQSVEK